MKKCFILAAFLSGCLCVSLCAQSAEKVTEMIETEETTVSQAAYFAASWLGLIDDGASETDAVNKLASAGVWTAPAETENPITLMQFAGLCLKAWNIKGGVLYSLTHSDRYAFRELQAKKFIKNTDDPYSSISGSNALTVFMRCSEIAEQTGE